VWALAIIICSMMQVALKLIDKAALDEDYLK
jgi:hypothetical protein